MDEIDRLRAAGVQALATGAWASARDSLREVLELEESAEALSGMADALWWLGEMGEAVRYRERAYAEFRRRSDLVSAAMTAIRLCVDYRANFGNVAVSGGWLARAARLVDDFGLAPLQGWILLIRAYDGDDPMLSEKWARESHLFAQQAGDLDLELCALSQIGASLIDQGRVAEGVALLDEAMAASLGGEGESRDTVVFTSCHMISSCSRCADFERALQWIRAADQFTEHYGCPFLYTFCRTLYGGVLVATGEWRQAEEELGVALEMSRTALSGLHGQALAYLAELRLAQGRTDEAQQLLSGLDDHPAAAPVLAAIQLCHGEPALAAATVLRRLEQVGDHRLESSILLELLGRSEIAQGRHDDATERGRELAELGADLDCLAMEARGQRLLGWALASGGDINEGKHHLTSALAAFVRLEMPFEVARTRGLLAEALGEAEPEIAVTEGRRALEAFEDLGAGADADRTAALLRALGVAATRVGPKGVGTLTKREREVLGLLGEGRSNPEIADRLYVSRRTVEHHVARVLSKLQLRNRAEAAAYAVREDVARNR